MEHEYLPFSVAKLTFGSCAAVPDGVDAVCGLLLEQAEGLGSGLVRLRSGLVRLLLEQARGLGVRVS